MKFVTTMFAFGLVKAETGEDLLYAETRSPGSSEDKVFTMPMEPVGEELPAGDDYYDVDYEDAEPTTFEQAVPVSRQLTHEEDYSSYSSYSYYSYYSYSDYSYYSYYSYSDYSYYSSYSPYYSYSSYYDYYYSSYSYYSYSPYYDYSSYSDYDYYYGEVYDDDWEDDDGYDWSMIEDITGEELSQEDKDGLDDLVESIVDMTESFATRSTWGALTGAAALALVQ